ncbi:GNAT family N-acetyltransferase [Kamptonema cortianum]|nr:GNAT family N-acetyltransferase [Geitlerinema splendidum]MDK3156163.1 GNAT family N-acetyltransferase [Kamptonema cortianum]
MVTDEAATKLAEVEIAKGTRYWTMQDDAGAYIALVGLYLDPVSEVRKLEPPQIIDVAVVPEHRGNGYARQLLEVAEAIVWASGHRHIWLFTDGENQDLHVFYTHLGYRRAGELPGYWGPGSMKAFYVKESPNEA